MVDGGFRMLDLGCQFNHTNTLNISTFYTLTIYRLPL